MNVRHLARYVLCLGLYYLGIVFLSRTVRRWRGNRRVVILAYHSFSDCLHYLDMAISPSLFIEQVRYLCKVFRVQTLSKALATWDNATDLWGDTAVITVDDGYADNFQPLVEVITKFDAPSTLYLTTNCIDAGQPTTVMWIMLAVHHAAVESINLSEIDRGTICIRTPREKEVAIREIDRFLKPLSTNQRSAVIKSLIAKTGRRELVRQFGQSVMLQWDQIRTMHLAGVEFGAHTLTHPMLSSLDPAAARHEIVASVQRVKEMVGVETVTFAYPYGSQDDVNEVVVEICKESGANAAVMLIEGDMPGSDFFRIPRMMVTSDRSTNPWGCFSRAVWACELEGLVGVARNLIISISGLVTRTYRSCEVRE
jgi:peptidoglycan/xylan/chitin deacetylase (PgdA/CDA1 family)